MKINIGSTNLIKINGVKDALSLYPNKFAGASIKKIEIKIEEFGHPKNLNQVMAGAKARAKEAFVDCDLSFGLESGLMEVPSSRTGYMEVSACAIYDGTNYFVGLSAAFEWPKIVLDLILSGRADGSKAFKLASLTEHEKLGARPGGIIGYLTEGRLTREEQIKQSIITAMVELEHPEYY